MPQLLNLYISSRQRKAAVISKLFTASWFNPTWEETNWLNQRRWWSKKDRRKKTETEREEKRKYLGVEIFSLSSKNHTCPESGNIHTRRSLSSQSPWKQWALLIRPIPLSSVNSPRQHGLYHSSCKQGRTPALKELPWQFNGVSESFKGRLVVLSPSFAL